ncbi:hypothetical protein V5O48_007446 [Marasmius crinis-equi]|uniref:Uncharacterized protein n=1 Tax=Marasmius crinis-equi TaxID=585013 RepID=A0ABR3FGN5_9AGAR
MNSSQTFIRSIPSSRSSTPASTSTPDSTSETSSSLSRVFTGPFTPYGPVVPNPHPSGRVSTRPKSTSFSERRGYNLAIPIPAPAVMPASFVYVTGPERAAAARFGPRSQNLKKKQRKEM